MPSPVVPQQPHTAAFIVINLLIFSFRPLRDTLSQTMKTFGIRQRLSMTASTWIRTMDLLFLGLLSILARVLGLCVVALNLAQLAIAPRVSEERRFVLRITPLIVLGTPLNAVVIESLPPFVLPLVRFRRSR